MKGVFLLAACILLSTFSMAAFASSKKGKRSGSNIYISKKYKGHSCPKPRKIINAVYF